LSCPICKLRKEKRFCLALHGRICAPCCGEQREITLDCPSACPYLQQAREHPKPRHWGDHPPEELFPAIGIREGFLEPHKLLLTAMTETLADNVRGLTDRELIGALANLAHSYQTLVSSGLVYQEALPNPAQQTVVAELQQLFQELREQQERDLGYRTLKDRDVLEALVFLLRVAYLYTSGRPLARGFVDSLRGPLTKESLLATDLATDPENRIILP
jgi:hypothetical protein